MKHSAVKQELDISLRDLLSSYSIFDISQFDISCLNKNKHSRSSLAELQKPPRMFVLPCETFVLLLALRRGHCDAYILLSTTGRTIKDSILMFYL